MKSSPIAVIDLGSNTARVVVFRIEPEGTFQVLADDKVPLRLIRQIDRHRRLSPAATDATLRVLADFRQIALGAGAGRIITVATAALREAVNGPEFLKQVRRRVGLSLRLLPPESEARCAFLGAVYGVAVEHGLVLDIGGGSIQLGHFRDRRLLATWSLPLGALRLSDRFLKSDPPGRQGLRRLQAFATKALIRSEIPELREDEFLVGTGGTIRSLSKIDTRLRGYPISRLHGYILTSRRIAILGGLLAGLRRAERAAVPGLSVARADSIAGGSLLAGSVMEQVGAGRMLVAGLGLREGLILEALGADLPAPREVRQSAVAALVSRFACWDERRAKRRKAIQETLCDALLPPGSDLARELLMHASMVLDVGRSVDYYRRHEHAAMILRSSGLHGFGHREILYLSLILDLGEDLDWRGRDYRPLLRNGDLAEIARSAVLLSLADEIEHRILPRRLPRLICRVSGRTVTLSEASLASWDPGVLGVSFARVFGKRLKISPGS
jgi:exopolyphosphatase/guanosine-5'-triphosphate,3'-diphosphate pyrophosphatase